MFNMTAIIVLSAGTPRNPRRDFQRQCSGTSTYHSNSIAGDNYMDDNDYDNEEAEKVVQYVFNK
jgi:hypothetical protein